MKHSIFSINERVTRRLMSGVALALPWLLPALVLADDKAALPDGRFQGYSNVTTVMMQDPGGHAPTWLLLIVLGMIVASVLFKNAKRTHLD